MLKINFYKVKNNSEPVLHIKEAISPSEDFLNRSKEILLGAKEINFSADLFYDEPYVCGNYHVKAEITVPSSRSLKPVILQRDFKFTEEYALTDTDSDDEQDADTIIKLDNEDIDLQKAVEDNLLLSIPSQVLTSEEKEKNLFPKGNNWQVISENSLAKAKQNQINPAFAKLKTLFNDKNDSHNS